MVEENEKSKGLLDPKVDTYIELEGGERTEYLANLASSLDEAKRRVGDQWLHELKKVVELFGHRKFEGYPLAIDLEMGLPIFGQMSKILTDKKEAKTKLTILPGEETILGSARRKLFRGDYPKDEQQNFIKRTYYTIVDDLDLAMLSLDKYLVPARDIHWKGEHEGYDRFDVKLTGFDTTRGAWETYLISFNQTVKKKKKKFTFTANKQPVVIKDDGIEFRQNFDKRFGKYFSLSPQTIFEDLEKYDEENISPISVRRTVYGPFKCKHTECMEPEDNLLEGNSSAFMFKITTSEVINNEKSGKSSEKRILFCHPATIYEKAKEEFVGNGSERGGVWYEVDEVKEKERGDE